VKILTRYVLSEVMSHAAIGIALFTFVIFMKDVSRILELVVRNSAALPSVAQIFFLTLPSALTVTLPMGVLVGILIGLSRLAADSEVTAMRASGIGAKRFVAIVFLFTIAAWLLALGNSLYLAPRSAAALGALQDSLKKSQASFEVQPRVFYEDFKNYVLYVEDTEPARGAAIWKNVFLADISTPGRPKITLAQQAVVVNADENTLRLHLTNGSQRETLASPEQFSITTFSESDVLISLPASDQGQVREVIPVSELTTGELLQKSRSIPGLAGKWYWIEFQRRLAYPTACLVLALVGIPLGLSSKKGGKSTGFVLTVILVFLYYFALAAGVALARQGKVPAAAGVWGANFVFAVAGVYLLWRVERSSLEVFSVRALRERITARILHAKIEQQEETGTALRKLSSRFPQLLDDYVLRQFTGSLGLILSSLIVLMLVFYFFDLFGDIVRNRVPLITVLQYLANVIPSTVYLMTPLSVLIAVLVTFGLMQKSNELTAMKATGVSIYRTFTPIILIAACLAAALFLFDQLYLPYANKRQDALRNQIKGKPAQTYLRADRRWIFGKNSTIYYYEFFDQDRNEFGNITTFVLDPSKFEITRQIYAANAHWEPGLNKFVLERGWVRSFQGDLVADYRTYDAATFDEFREEPGYFKKEVKQFSEMNFSELRKYIADLQQSGFDVSRLRVQLHRKIAFPIVTLVMAVLAVPFSLSAGRRGALTGVAVALCVGMAYWFINDGFVGLGNAHQLPPSMAAWFPDIIFALIGGYLILKVPT
jgi:LPS export ABC transporter permease LptF/LPS export ABC transporter permease LptG